MSRARVPVSALARRKKPAAKGGMVVKHVVHGLVVIFLLTLLASIAWFVTVPFASLIDAVAADSRTQVITYLERLTGSRVEFDSVNPAFLRYIAVKNLRVVLPLAPVEPGDMVTAAGVGAATPSIGMPKSIATAGERVDVRVGELRLHFSLAGLLRRDLPAAITHIEVRDADVTVSSVHDAATVARMLEQTAAGLFGNGADSRDDDGRRGTDTAVIYGDLGFSLRNVRVAVETRDVHLELTDLRASGGFHAESAGVGVDYEVTAAVLAGGLAAVFDERIGGYWQAETRLHTAGTMVVPTDSTAFAATGVLVLAPTTATIDNTVIAVEAHRFGYDVAAETIQVVTLMDQSAMDARLTFDLGTGMLTAVVAADRWLPAETLQITASTALFGDIAALNQWLASPVTTNVSMMLGGPYATPSIEGRFDTRIYVDQLQSTVQIGGTIEPIAGGYRVVNTVVRSSFAQVTLDGDISVAEPAFVGRVIGETTGAWSPFGNLPQVFVDATITATGDRVRLGAGSLMVSGVRVFAADAVLSRYVDNEYVAAGSFSLTPNAPAEFQFSALFRPEDSLGGGPPALDITAIVDNIHARPVVDAVAALFPGVKLPDLSWFPEDWSLAGSVAVASDLETSFINISNFSVFAASQRVARAAVQVTDQSVSVFDLEFALEGVTGRGTLVGDLRPGGTVDFSTELSIRDVPYAFDGTFDPAGSLAITGEYGSQIAATFAPGPPGTLPVFDVRGAIEEFPLPASAFGDAVWLSTEFSGRFRSETDWELALARVALFGLSLPLGGENRTIDLSSSARIGPDSIQLVNVTVADQTSTLVGELAATYQISPQWRAEITAGLTAAQDGAQVSSALESYTLAMVLDTVPGVAGRSSAFAADLTTVGSLTIGNSPLLRFVGEGLRGFVSSNVDFAGPIGSLAVQGNVSLVDATFNNEPVVLTGRFAGDTQRVVVDNLTGRFITNELDHFVLAVDRTTGEVALDADLVVGPVSRRQPVTVALRAAVDSADEVLALGDLQTGTMRGLLAIGGLPVPDGSDSEWVFEFERSGESIALTGGFESAVTATVGFDGRFEATVRAPLPVAFDAIGRIFDGQIEANLNRIDADLRDFAGLLVFDPFRIAGGAVSGSVLVNGPIIDPDFFGTLVVDSAVTSLSMLPAPVFAERVFVVFDEKVMTVNRTRATVGANAEHGSADVTAVFNFQRWIPTDYAVGVVADRQTGVNVTSRFNRVSIDGWGTGNVDIVGGPGFVRIGGNVTAEATSIAIESADQEVAAGERPYTATEVDLSIVTGRGVEFFWPSRAFPVMRTFAQIGERVRLTYDSDQANFGMVGTVSIRGGEIFYFDRSFFLRTGHIAFNEGGQTFDPRITAEAEIREIYNQTPIRISLIVNDSRLSRFQPRLVSTPSLTDAEIIAILGGNVFPQGENISVGLQQAVLLGTDIVSQFGLLRGMETAVRDTLQLDLFSIRTQLFQNLVSDVIGDPLSPLSRRTPSLGRYLDNTTVFLGRYIGTDLFLELLLQLRTQSSDAIASANQPFGGFAIESEINLEWRTPYFMLQWNFAPRNPQSLFLTDNTFTFSWAFSY